MLNHFLNLESHPSQSLKQWISCFNYTCCKQHYLSPTHNVLLCNLLQWSAIYFLLPKRLTSSAFSAFLLPFVILHTFIIAAFRSQIIISLLLKCPKMNYLTHGENKFLGALLSAWDSGLSHSFGINSIPGAMHAGADQEPGNVSGYVYALS